MVELHALRHEAHDAAAPKGVVSRPAEMNADFV